MKRICPFCGFQNSSSAVACGQCSGSLESAEAERPSLLRAVMWWGTPLAVLTFLAVLQLKFEMVLRARPPEVGIQEPSSQPAEKADTEASGKALVDPVIEKWLSDPEVLSGKVGRTKREEEWVRRQAHDPAFASTPREFTILEMERIGKDSNLAAEESLRRVAEMVLPPGSRVEVTRQESGLFRVRAAFRLYAFSAMNSGGATRHESVDALRSDLEEATAQVMRALFDFCGTRGIESVSVSCNGVVSVSTKNPLGKEEEDLRHRSLYRATLDSKAAARVASWRDISIPAVKRLMTVDRDLTPTLTMKRAVSARAIDKDEPLEF